jgi:hypothetical protein
LVNIYHLLIRIYYRILIIFLIYMCINYFFKEINLPSSFIHLSKKLQIYLIKAKNKWNTNWNKKIVSKSFNRNVIEMWWLIIHISWQILKKSTSANHFLLIELIARLFFFNQWEIHCAIRYFHISIFNLVTFISTGRDW